ncbi:MAG TPA: PfkB family carbohydrate kinase, partial [Polyangiaceae bacterium]
MDRPLRIATLGDLVLDVIVIGDPNAEKTARDAEGAVRITPGGGAANFAVAAARAGAEVAFFGRVGDDPAGRLLVAELARDGVTARVKTTSAGKTGHVLVLVASGADGQNRMISDPGASAALAPEDLDEAVLRGADLVHLTGYSWLREGPSAAARAALDAAKAGGAKV